MQMSHSHKARPAYADVVSRFTLEDEARRFSGDIVSAVNACVECCDRHCGSDRVALRCLDQQENLNTYTFEDLREMSSRVANVLHDQGIRAGDTVAGLLPRTVDLVALILGTWRLGAVYQPLFTAFGPKAIEHRLTMSGAKMIVTDVINRTKLETVNGCPPIAIVSADGTGIGAADLDFRASCRQAAATFDPVMRKGDDPFLMMSTSGTTGLPKGVCVPLRAMMSFSVYMRYAVDLRPDDVFWNIADPGWAYGLYYAVIGPLLEGVATTLFEGGFSAESTCRIVRKIGVTSLAGSPTAFRLLIAAGSDAAAQIRGQLRVVSSAGEPLNPEVIRWFASELDVTIHDHYGQTELGMCVNNHHGLDHPVRPGSAGLAMPGYRVAVIDPQGRELGVNEAGVLAVDIANSPLLWFTGYHQIDTPAIAGGYYRTGDMVELGADGSVSFIGRDDDVITSSGYRIGPFDVESALTEHPAVVETAVIGVPDPERTELVKAFVVLGKGVEPSPELAEELSQHVKQRLSAHAYPRAIEFVDELPKTPSGKIQRFMLRKAEVAKQQQQENGA